jgi:HEAT repeat protein
MRVLEVGAEARPPLLHPAEAVALLGDPEVRLRDAAARHLALGPTPAAEQPLLSLLRDDEWPRVRGAAAAALGVLSARNSEVRTRVEPQLGRALRRDESPLAREAVADVLAVGGGPDSLSELRGALKRDASARVRAAAARALGRRCDVGALDLLTSAAQRLPSALDADAVALGLEATTALLRLAPPDLDARLGPLADPAQSEALPAELRASVARARARHEGACHSEARARNESASELMQ